MPAARFAEHRLSPVSFKPMRHASMLLALTFPLSLMACAPSLTANEDGGTVRNVGALRQDEAFKLASEHCAMAGKAMRITAVAALYGELSFTCVKS